MSDTKELLQRARRQFPPPEGIMESLSRRRDRKQRNRRLGTATLALVFAAAAIGGVVRAFDLAETRRPAELPNSPDSWTRIQFPSDLSGPQISSIAAGGPGLVAVGSEHGKGAVWTSIDGRTWRVRQHFGSSALMGVTGGGPGLVAVAIGENGYSAQIGDDAPVWTSVDGLSWERAPSDPVFRGVVGLWSVTEGGPGLVAVGSDRDGPQAWYSSDGVTWELASVPPAPSDVIYDTHNGLSFAEAWMQDVTVAGDRLVAVGSIGIDTGGGGRYYPAIWTSTDGVTWSEVPLDPDIFPRESEVRSVAAGPGGFVIVGGIFPRVPMAWASEDGLTWRRVSDQQGAFVSLARRDGAGDQLHFEILSVAAGPGGYVGVGEDSWCLYNRWDCTTAWAALWTSTDGTRWVRVRQAPTFRLGHTEGVGTAAVVAWGSRFVAAGSYGGAEEETAIWISEAPGAGTS